MADSAAGPGPDADTTGSDTAEAPDWGRLLDAAGIVAGVILVVIIADIWTDGRLVSRRLRRGGEGEPGDPAAD
jgi:hypothetical protein